MTDPRLAIIGGALAGMGPLFEADELLGIVIELDDPEYIYIRAKLQPAREVVVRLWTEALDDPLDAAVAAFDQVQDELAEEGPTRAQARPPCQPGHGHPATCERRDQAVVLICPNERTEIRDLLRWS